MNITLHCVSSCNKLIESLVAIQRNYYISVKNDFYPTVIIMLDHILDGQTGLQVKEEVNIHQKRFNLDLFQVLVSSTEDLNTINNYQNASVEQFIEKPLTAPKVRLLLDQLQKLKKN